MVTNQDQECLKIKEILQNFKKLFSLNRNWTFKGEITVTMGDHHLYQFDITQFSTKVKNVNIHQNYIRDTLENDICLLKVFPVKLNKFATPGQILNQDKSSSSFKYNVIVIFKMLKSLFTKAKASSKTRFVFHVICVDFRDNLIQIASISILNFLI